MVKFKERYNQEIPKWLRLLGAWRINTDSIDFKWGYFAPRLGLEFTVNQGTYFDQRYAIDLALGFGKFRVYLPFKTKLPEGCDMPRYGFCVHNDTFWIYKGGEYKHGQTQDKYIAWYLPFFNWVFDGHWIVDDNMQWVPYKEQVTPYTEVHPYTYVLQSGEIQQRTATCTIEKRKWHRKWFPFLTMTRQVIDVEFSDEVGERTGSWKGGTIGCGYDMTPSDSIETCLRRMEAERKFK